MTDHPPGRYQLLPPLGPDEYAALRVDIAQRGVDRPAFVTRYQTRMRYQR